MWPKFQGHLISQKVTLRTGDDKHGPLPLVIKRDARAEKGAPYISLATPFACVFTIPNISPTPDDTIQASHAPYCQQSGLVKSSSLLDAGSFFWTGSLLLRNFELHYWRVPPQKKLFPFERELVEQPCKHHLYRVIEWSQSGFKTNIENKWCFNCE